MAKEDSQNVLIRSKILRAGGSKIDVFGLKLHFKVADGQPDTPEAAHVAPVPFERADVIYRLLSIKEGYELADPDATLPPRPAATSSQTIASDQAAKPAEEKKPVIIKNEAGEEINLSAMAPDELRVLARDTFKVKVHHKWDDARVIQTILEAMRGEG